MQSLMINFTTGGNNSAKDHEHLSFDPWIMRKSRRQPFVDVLNNRYAPLDARCRLDRYNGPICTGGYRREQTFPAICWCRKKISIRRIHAEKTRSSWGHHQIPRQTPNTVRPCGQTPAYRRRQREKQSCSQDILGGAAYSTAAHCARILSV